jgi:23S rRNA (uracil1939-C5)-methyltransferase
LAAEYHQATVEECLPALLAAAPPARVVLNPGRAGCRAGVVEALAAAGVPGWAYLSCNPDTLARDLARAVEQQVRVISVTPVDLMPQTDHVEALALLEVPRS